MPRYVKTLALLWGLGCLGIGALAGLAFLANSIDTWHGDLALTFAVPVLAGLGGGVLVTVAVLRSLGKTPDRPLRLPPAWALAGGLVLALAAGLGLWQAEISESFLVPLFAAAAASLAPLAVAAWLLQSALRGAGQAEISVRRGQAALGLGATAGVALALVLNMLLSAGVTILVFGLDDNPFDLVGGFIESLVVDLIGPGFDLFDLVMSLVGVAILVPLVEELVKPLAILPLLKRLPAARDALLLGVLAGAGFAAVENLLYAAMFDYQWGGVLVTRSLGAALHPFGAGLMAVAWWGVLRRQPTAGEHWLRNYAIAVGAHGLWNGTCVVAAGVAGAWFQGWEVDVLGAASGAVLLALLAVEGLGLLLALRAVARRLAPAGETAPLPALPTERAIAVWGVICLVVLLPVGLALLRTL